MYMQGLPSDGTNRLSGISTSGSGKKRNGWVLPDTPERKKFNDLTGHERLAYAVICSALKDALASSWSVNIRERAEARKWLRSKDTHAFGAEWWAEAGNMRETLDICRQVLAMGKELDRSIVCWQKLWDASDTKRGKASWQPRTHKER